MRSIPRGLTLRACVSPPWNSPDPWAPGTTPTSQEMDRISSALPPSSPPPPSRHPFFGGGGLPALDAPPAPSGRPPPHTKGPPGAVLVHPPGPPHTEGRQVQPLIGGVDLPLPADQPKAHGPDGTVEGQPGQAHGQAGRIDAGDVVRVGLVHGEDCDDDLDLVAEVWREGGTKGAIGQPRGERGGLGGTPLAPEEPPRDLAGRIHPLLDVDGEREEIDALAGPRGRTGGQDLGL